MSALTNVAVFHHNWVHVLTQCTGWLLCEEGVHEFARFVGVV